jgi:hypothetical protein
MATLCEYGATARLPSAAAANLWQRYQLPARGGASLPPPGAASGLSPEAKGLEGGSSSVVGWPAASVGSQAIGGAAGWPEVPRAPLGSAGAAAAAAAVREAAVREMLERNAALVRWL